MSGEAPSPAEWQLALDAMRDGVILWSAQGTLILSNRAAAALFDLPPELVKPGARRAEAMAHMARRGDYGATGDPEGFARDLSDRFGRGEVETLTRRLPDGRFLRADARLVGEGRLLVTYREVQAAQGSLHERRNHWSQGT